MNLRMIGLPAERVGPSQLSRHDASACQLVSLTRGHLAAPGSSPHFLIGPTHYKFDQRNGGN
jgi:hypothetical protein